MKRLVLPALFAASLLPAVAQEKLPREESLKYAFFACANLKEMLNTPIATDPDVKRPVAVRDEDYGGLVMPETKLKPETFSKAGKDPVAVGQLWMVKLTPVQEDQPVPTSRLRMVHVRGDNGEADVVCCALAVRNTGDGLELLVYGKAKEPVAHVPVKSVSSTGEDPVDVSAERTDQGANVTLRFLGKYEAKFKVTDPDR